jgi:ADP-dependent NAD(P)H-hydrate dehydratase
VVLDALAMDVVLDLRRFEGTPLLTPHAGEMAHLTGISKESVNADPERHAREAALRWNAVVALKGATTYIATPEGDCWRHVGGQAGLGTSGSGDVLAGIIVGLAARGAPLAQAAAWGVALHAQAGSALAERLGPMGFLARELPGEIPTLLEKLAH